MSTPKPGQVWNAIDQEWFWTPEWQAGEREATAQIAAGDVEVCTDFDTMASTFEHYDGVYAAHGPDRSRASVQPYTRECMVDLDCGGCACGAVMAPCSHCAEHWTEDQP